jgi:hypothetical protein
MKHLVNVASFGLIPVPWNWSDHHHRFFASGELAVQSDRDGERVATQAELAELDRQLRQAQAAADPEE